MKHAHPLLGLLVSICFTSMFNHCYMPPSMINSVIIHIIKNKSGDFTEKIIIDQSHYPVLVFEYIIIIHLEEYLCTNDNQFGFNLDIQSTYVFMH